MPFRNKIRYNRSPLTLALAAAMLLPANAVLA